MLGRGVSGNLLDAPLGMNRSRSDDGVQSTRLTSHTVEEEAHVRALYALSKRAVQRVGTSCPLRIMPMTCCQGHRVSAIAVLE